MQNYLSIIVPNRETTSNNLRGHEGQQFLGHRERFHWKIGKLKNASFYMRGLQQRQRSRRSPSQKMSKRQVWYIQGFVIKCVFHKQGTNHCLEYSSKLLPNVKV